MSAHKSTRAIEPRSGMVLIVVLIVVTMVALAGYRFADYMVIENKAVVQYGDALQAQHAVGSGVEFLSEFLEQPSQGRQLAGGLDNNPAMFRGVALLEADPLTPHCRFSIIAPPAEMNLAGGIGSGGMGAGGMGSGVAAGGMAAGGIRFGVANESAKLNLTVLDIWDHKRPGSGRLALMKLPGMTAEVADAILDWVDTDSVPRESGAEEDYYQGLTPPYTPRNGPPEVLDELLLVRGVTREQLFGTRGQGSDPTATSATGQRPSAARLSGAVGQEAVPWADFLTLYSAERNLTPAGRQRVNLNASRLAALHAALAEALGKEWADYIVAYRQYGLYQGSEAVSDGSTFQLDLQTPGQTTIRSLFELIGGKVRVPGRTPRDAIVLASPLADDPQEVRVKLPQLMEQVSITSATKIVGRININLAPEPVLRAIPGIDEAIAGRIAAGQRQGADQTNRSQPIWPLIEDLVDRKTMESLLPYITAGGDVFRAQVAGFFDTPGPTARVEIVLDATTSPARIVLWRDLGVLGLGYPRAWLGAGQDDQGAAGVSPVTAPTGGGLF